MTAFSSLSDKLTKVFSFAHSKGKLSEKDIDQTVSGIRTVLLDADVSLPVVQKFCAQVKEKAMGSQVSKSLNPSEQVVKIVYGELESALGEGIERPLRFSKVPPTVIMLLGLQGAGKTTLAGKLAYWLKQTGHSPLLVAADLQRAAAVEQVSKVASEAGAGIYTPDLSGFLSRKNPVKVSKDAIDYAKRKLYDVVIIDTAGRLAVDDALIKEASQIKKAVEANEVLLVVDSMIGQDAVKVAEAFDKGVGFTGIVLTKLDGDARGGAALSVTGMTGKPILFASDGERLKDFEVFHPDRMASRILDMGDTLTLIERAEREFDEKSGEEVAKKIKAGSFGLDDFVSSLEQIRKMGSLKKMLMMLPSMNQYRNQIEDIDEGRLDRITAIISSMTPAEKANPDIINGSRRARIARGSGTNVSEVNSLLSRFAQASKMMKKMGPNMASGPMMGDFGMGMPSGKAPAKKGSGKKKKFKSGNPAKREEEERALLERLNNKKLE
ncbi:MAG: signal recognition particle protein [Aeriscardovia sp.]|nr:signal recognition particle protein [Aeriscardovia sp.]MBQ1299266.1 signal recognition particle protein [Aeriscardovia sp.]